MFSVVTTTVSTSIASVRAFLRAIAALETTERAQGTGSIPSRCGKAMVFIQLYASYEACIKHSVSAALNAIAAHNLPHASIRPSLLALVLDPQCRSLTDIKFERSWPVRIELFSKTRSTDPLSTVVDTFPVDGSHFRYSQLVTIWTLFNVPGDPVPEPRLIGRVKELVDIRNLVAHGDVAPMDLGSRYSVTDLEHRIDDIERACLHFVGELDRHCASATNLL